TQLPTALFDQAIRVEVAIVRRPGSIGGETAEFVQRAVAEAIERHVPQLAKHLPLRLRNRSCHASPRSAPTVACTRLRASRAPTRQARRSHTPPASTSWAIPTCRKPSRTSILVDALISGKVSALIPIPGAACLAIATRPW